MKIVFLLLLSSLLFCSVCIVKVEARCLDQCALDRAEKSLKLTLGIMRLIRNEDNTEEGNGDNNDNNNDNDNNDGKRTTSTTRKEPPINTPTTPGPHDNENDCNLPPTNCADIQVLGHRRSGLYDIYPKWESHPVSRKVYCDLATEGGGWTVIQRRNDYNDEPQLLFNKSWSDYKNGFGNLQREFWIGNDVIHNLTKQDRMILRIDAEDWEGQKRFCHYRGFDVKSESNTYQMGYTNYYDTTLGGDGFAPYIIGGLFRTVDHDTSGNKPARRLGTGFWFQDYAYTNFESNPNGVYYEKGDHLGKENGIYHKYFQGKTYSLKRFEMKVRPEFFLSSD